MSLKRIQTIVKQMCTICSEAVNANFIVADDNLEKIASSYITHTKDELKPISPNSIIARVGRAAPQPRRDVRQGA